MTRKMIAAMLAILMLAGCSINEKSEQIASETSKAPVVEQVAKEEKEPMPPQEEKPVEDEITEQKTEENVMETVEEPSQEKELPVSDDPQVEQPAEQTPEPEHQPVAEVIPAHAEPTPPINEGTVFEGHHVTVNDRNTPADRARGKDWPITTWYFFSQNGEILGSISGTAMEAIINRYQVRDNTGANVPPDGSSWETWFAKAFNEYRQISTPLEDTTPEKPKQHEVIYEKPDESEPHYTEPEVNESHEVYTPSIEIEEPDKPDCYEWALKVIELTNAEREKNGLQPLEIDDDLMELAQTRAEEVSVKYSHERPDGTSVVKEYGYGENVGAKASPQKQVSSWMSSEGHRTNILIDWYNSIGVGCYHDDDGKTYWVQIFSK